MIRPSLWATFGSQSLYEMESSCIVIHGHCLSVIGKMEINYHLDQVFHILTVDGLGTWFEGAIKNYLVSPYK